MNVNVLITLLGGLGLFLFGIKQMEDGLKLLAGDYLKQVMHALTKNRMIGVIVGFTLTTLMQSSSATTTMIVGFVNAGFVQLTQAVGFILGANIGSTTTGQLMSFKLDQYSLLILGVGAIVYLFAPRAKLRNTGLALIGFGMLFFGMVVMKDAIKPLQDSGYIEHWFSMCSADSIWSTLLGVCIAAIATAVVQSSGATVGIIIALGSAGAIKNFADVIPLILGCRIGTCATALLASLRTNLAARKAAVIHLAFNVFGVALILSTASFWEWVIPKTSGSMARQIANGHTIFQVVSCIVFLPLTVPSVKLLNWIRPEKVETTIDLLQYRSFANSEHLTKPHLNTPGLALIAVQKEVQVITQIAHEMIIDVRKALIEYDEDLVRRVERHEDVVDTIKNDLHDYIILLTQQHLTNTQAYEARLSMEAAGDMERVADHVEAMLKYVKLAHEGVMVLDENNKSRIVNLLDRAIQLADVVRCYLDRSCSIRLGRLTGVNNQLTRDIRVAYQYYDGCLRTGSWNLFSDLSFLELVSAIERYSKHYRGFIERYVKPLVSLEEGNNETDEPSKSSGAI